MCVTLQVCETFVSIQGESTRAGQPCFFIRLAGCNLDCTWCDTPQARAGGRPVSAGELVAGFRASGAPLAAVTGGEPLWQPGTPALLRELRAVGEVLVETNGSRDISGIPPDVVAVMDFKCPSSGQTAAMDWRNLDRLRPDDEIKFVLADRGDYEWAREIIRARGLPGRARTVLLSPVAGRLEPATLAEWLLADRLPARLNLQLHKLIWGTVTRGV